MTSRNWHQWLESATLLFMTSLHDLLAYLDDYLRVGEYSDSSVNGLQVEGKLSIKRLATAVSASEEVIQTAVLQGADALLVHHGLFWEKDPYVIDRAKKRKLQLLLDAQISLLAYHIPLDAHEDVGNNWKAAKDMLWANLCPFGIHKGKQIGVKAKVGSIPPSAFQALLEQYYQHQAFTALGGNTSICQVALISGGAHWQIVQAYREGMDAFVTGSFDEPIWHIAHEEGIHFFALGHAATERVGPQALGKHLCEQFSLETFFIDSINPF